MARVAINTGSVANDGTGDTLRVAGGIINDNFSEIYNQFGDGTTLTPTWDKTDAGINTTSSVGVGTTNPRFTLEVGSIGAAGTSLWINGDARVTGILTVGTASIIINGSSNVINVGSGITIDGNAGTVSASSINIGGSTLTGAGVTYITAGSGISVDQNTGNVTITSTGGGEIYWAQNATGINTTSNVGIGTTTASSALTIQGDVIVSGISTLGTVEVYGFLGATNTITAPSLTATTGNINATSGNIVLATSERELVWSSGNGIIRTVSAGSSLSIRGGNPGENMGVFTEGSSVDLYYDGNKKFETLGTGVTVTGTIFTNQLSVSGVTTCASDVNVGIDTSSGLVLTSPNGTQYRLIVANDGTLSTTAV